MFSGCICPFGGICLSLIHEKATVDNNSHRTIDVRHACGDWRIDLMIMKDIFRYILEYWCFDSEIEGILQKNKIDKLPEQQITFEIKGRGSTGTIKKNEKY